MDYKNITKGENAMFGLKKKFKEQGEEGAKNTRNFNAAEEKLRELGIDKKMYDSYLKFKGIGRLNNTPELVDEYLTDDWIKGTDIICWVELNESYLDVNNAAGTVLSGGRSNFTTTSRKKLKVKTLAYIADKGLVFKKAINKAEDLRLPWDIITDVKVDGKEGEIICDNVTYVVKFLDKNIMNVFISYVDSHKKGIADDGWD